MDFLKPVAPTASDSPLDPGKNGLVQPGMATSQMTHPLLPQP
jgi:hypothetical protein